MEPPSKSVQLSSLCARFSEPESQCCIEVADVFSGRGLLQKISGEEVKVSGGAREMRRKGAIQGQPRLVSNKSGGAQAPRANEESGEVVDAVVNGAAPIERHFR